VIPPGLLGYDPAGAATTAPARHGGDNELELTVAVHPVIRGPYSALYDGLAEALRAAGIRLRPTTETMEQYAQAESRASVDLVVGRWSADYPDADAFAHILHSREGKLGTMCGSPELDRRIKAGRVETDPDARHATYRQLEEIVAREARLLPLFHEQGYRFARPDVEGLSVSHWTPVAYDNLRIVG
jgi:peptide/nickel transport system substrate-binding protein